MSDHSANHTNLKWKGSTSGEKRCSLQCFENAWHECFFIHHDFTGKDDVSAVDRKKILGSVDDELTIFLDVSDDLISPCEADEVWRYCEGCTSLGEDQDGVGKFESRRDIWIDDRNNSELTGKGITRKCGYLSTTGLLKHLKQPRFKLGNVPDAERRLIHIANLTPEIILAIAATTPFLQVPAVRDAIIKHVTFRPSIQVHVPSDGKPTFQLEFHIPFFALRKAPQADTPPPSARSRRLRSWEGVTLLTRDNNGSESQESYRLHRAQVSFVIHGFDEWNWTAWAFEDTDHELQESDDLAADAGVGDDEAVLIEDPIAYGLLDANDPIWRPREYFTKLLEIRIKKVREEWDALVHMLQHDRNENKQLQPFIYSKSRRTRSGRTEEMNASFQWTRGRLNLVTELLVVLLGIIHEWDTFLSPDGDWGYFSDLDRFPSHSREFHVAGQSLRSINRAFKRLENNRQRLLSMKETLSDDLSTLKLLLSLEGNAATESSAFMSKFTIWVLCPYSLSVGMFSMQPSVIPFQLTFTWFVITMMIMMFAIFVIQWLMRRWALWHSPLLWVKLKKVIEQHQEETTPGMEPEYQENRVPDILRQRGAIDLDRDATELQKMRARISSSRLNISPV